MIAVLGSGAYLLFVWPLRDPHPKVGLPLGALAIRDVKIYPSPDAVPIERGIVVARNGIITAVAPGAEIPSDAQVLSCKWPIAMAS